MVKLGKSDSFSSSESTGELRKSCEFKNENEIKEGTKLVENIGYTINRKYSSAPHTKFELDLMMKAYDIGLKGGKVLSVSRLMPNVEMGTTILELPCVDPRFALDCTRNLTPIDADQFYKLHIIKEGNYYDKLKYDCDYRVRFSLVEKDYEVEYFINDPHYMVRCAVAGRGVGLDILVNDSDFRVRQQVAYQKFGLDKLVNDEHPAVRAIVAYVGYGHDVLVNDANTDVRGAIAERGDMLDKLVNDKSVDIRLMVACHGFGLEKLSKDRSKKVSGAAQEILRLKAEGKEYNFDDIYYAFSMPKKKEI